MIGQHNHFAAEYLQHSARVPAGFMSYTSVKRAEGLDIVHPALKGGVPRIDSKQASAAASMLTGETCP